MYKIYVSDDFDETYHNLLEFTFNDYVEATNFVKIILEHSKDYVVEITKEKGE